jgi:hypothetical protein
MNPDRFPRIPRRREPIIAGLINWTLALGLCVFIGWLAAQGF